MDLQDTTSARSQSIVLGQVLPTETYFVDQFAPQAATPKLPSRLDGLAINESLRSCPLDSGNQSRIQSIQAVLLYDESI